MFCKIQERIPLSPPQTKTGCKSTLFLFALNRMRHLNPYRGKVRSGLRVRPLPVAEKGRTRREKIRSVGQTLQRVPETTIFSSGQKRIPLSTQTKRPSRCSVFTILLSYTKNNPIFISISINTCATATSAPPNIIIPAIIAYATTIRPITMGRSKNTIIAAIAVKIFLYV